MEFLVYAISVDGYNISTQSNDHVPNFMTYSLFHTLGTK